MFGEAPGVVGDPISAQLSIPNAINRALAGAAVIAMCAVAGWAIAHGSSKGLLLVGALAAGAVVLMLAELGLKALYLWAPLSVVLYPLSGLLDTKLVTFDRVWAGGMVVLLLLLARPAAQARASRRLFAALALLTAVIGVRSIFTPADTLYPIRVTFDCLVLPLILFEVVRRAVGTRPERAERIALSLAIAGLLLGLIGVAEQVFGFELATVSGSEVRVDVELGVIRLSGPYDVPEVYGLSLALTLAATLYWLIMRPRSAEAWYAGLFVVGIELIALFFNFFRVGWISALIVTIAVFGLRPQRYTRALGTLLVATLLFGVVFTQLMSKIPAVSSRVNNTENFDARLASYKLGLEIWRSAPVFGVGATLFHDVAVQRPVVQINGVNSTTRAHSSFLNTLAEAGVVGLLALLIVVAAIVGLVRALNRYRGSPQDTLIAAVLVGAGAAYLLYSLTLTMLPYAPANEFYAVLLGIGAGRLDWHASRRAEVAPAVREQLPPEPTRVAVPA